ncbi:nucleotidyltransferase family protein [Marinobacter mobilis]|uniref:Molybdenum cofactor cytidylyltransferase n=1 Tax=Marinobacter mobilis TaxID=488533 RepID=A0A1H2Z1K2_9GAMM|nr:nucleotidyltransferase family protein [Marinobacter mobilis]SDX11187.1 molybdenum cofactor cytidylyltransferase [Marinobacter mobilis]
MVNSRPNTPVLVLAAGASRRMGRAKQLLGWGRGCLLDQAIGLARVLSPEVFVVGGARYPLVRYRCKAPVSGWVYAHDWSQGLSASLKAGVSALPGRSCGVFVMVADQPLLSVDGLRALAEAARTTPDQPVAASYGDRPGVPAYLPRWVWPQVMALEGDQGAGVILRDVRARRIRIAGVERDLDTPEDWRKLFEA